MSWIQNWKAGLATVRRVHGELRARPVGAKTVLIVAMFQLCLFASAVFAQERARAASEVPDRAALEQRFESTMSGASLIGYFTVAGQERVTAPKDDQYRVSKIEKLESGRWLFTARMGFGDREVSIPMPFEVQWAGDTPVITLTNQEIPGLGTFTARVLIYGDQYAGTWQHGQVRGHMWGKVEKAGAAKP